MDRSLSRHSGVVALSGELDAAAYETVRASLAAARAEAAQARVVLAHRRHA